MKLIGSNIEKKIREVLINEHIALFKTNQYLRLTQVLKMHFPNMKTAYFLEHTPEQGEDIYTLLVDIDMVVKIEISRDNSEIPIVEVGCVRDFRIGLSKINQIKMDVAIDLAKKDITDG